MADVSAVQPINLEKDENTTNITYNDVAKKLLKDRLLLTALELHTELIESGKEVKYLKDFFSNPSNFEPQTQEFSSKISRSGSQTTLDSLDFTRYSEDGERGSDERIAVLEFELRKAKETISALRNNLTVATGYSEILGSPSLNDPIILESEKNTPDKNSVRLLNNDSIKPHEQRALNFLINEYLLLHGYKLTSITFADENENQDFEDWDDVGLNISKPAELLTLYREGLKQTGYDLTTVGIQTDFILKDDKTSENEVLNEKVINVTNQMKRLQEENEKLEKLLENSSHKSPDILNEIKPPTNTSSKNSTIGSDSPEHFELIEKSNSLSEDNDSNNSADWTKLTIIKDQEIMTKLSEINESKCDEQRREVVMDKLRNLPDNYKKALLYLCPMDVPIKLDNRMLEDMLNEKAYIENVVHTVSESLLRIIPNIILNKREEAIPLLVSAVQLNANGNVRDKLLQQLFNLKKKPSDTERTLILTGIIAIAKYSKESVVENEVLPQCWEQLTHKHVERRLLVAESCRMLIPYVTPPIRNSLMLSMLQQMLDDREEIVREEVIKALALVVAFCNDVDKYHQCEELAFNALKDSSSSVINSTTHIFFPVLAKWSLDVGRLFTNLIRNLLQKLSDTLKHLKNESPNKAKPSSDVILHMIHVLNQLLPFVLICVANNEVILNRIEKDMTIELRPELLRICTNLTNPSNFFTSSHNVGMILYEFDQFIAENNDYKWNELEWLMDIVFPDLLNSLNHIEITQHELLQAFIDLFSNICITFGKNFTTKIIRPLFQTHVQNLEQILSSFNQYSPSLNIIPVYLVSVLSYCDKDETSSALKRFLWALPLCGTPLDCLEITVKGLCNLGMQDIVVAGLWDGVVHQKPLVRAVTAGLFATIIGLCNETLLNAKVTPALVTLANDSDILVRTATIPALGYLVTDSAMQELHDKAYMQLQMFLSDPTTKENHTLLRQLVVTMGNIVISCKPSFRQDVILPQLASLSNYMSQMTSQTRKVDMAVALIEAYSNVIYSPINNTTFSNIVLPGLRCLDLAINENQTLHSHREGVTAMIKECENRADLASPQSPSEKGNKIAQNMNQGVEDMKQRVSKMFNKPTGAKPPSLPNLQGLFKKK